MGVYIPNMSKPKSCKECESFYIEFYMGEGKVGSACTLNDDDGSTIEADYNSCPLIEIDQEAIDIAQDIIDGCKRFKERIADEHNT